MPLENSPPIEPPNEAYIDDLNEDWPAGTDYPSDGDNHIRGIKNVLKRTFPLLTGPVMLTQDQLQGVMLKDTVCIFYQAAAPTGWTRVDPEGGNRMLIVTDGGAGVELGTDDPLIHNKVAAHTHVVNGTTGGDNGNHTHDLTVYGGGHAHNYIRSSFALYPSYGTANVNFAVAEYETTVIGAGEHQHSGTTTGVSGPHTHSMNFTSQVNAGADAWIPRITACLLAKKD